jgi:hypothetical protein
MTLGTILTVIGGLLIMGVTLGSAFTLGRGVPETMRAVALRLLVHARRIEAWRAEMDAVTRQALEAETR